MATPSHSACDAAIRFLENVFGGALQQAGFRLWDGALWPDERPRAATFVLKHPGALREMFGHGSELALAEAFLRDDFDIEGDTESAFELAEVLQQREHDGWRAALRTALLLRRLPGKRTAVPRARAFAHDGGGRHSLARDRQAVSFHYDLSNEFYQLWLDRRMVYSCGYFERADAPLDDAQEAKLALLCRKLRLRPGQRLLDIGCGWGGLAIFAAQHCGVQVVGVTLSARQAELAAARVREAGVDDRVTIHLRDYREIDPAERFDAIVSVGMSEHVGAGRLEDYFRAAGRLLRPGGVFLNHAIGESVRPRPRRGPSFMDEYVFPDSDIPPIPAVLQAAEAAGLEVRDVENLREHYAITLRHWLRRLEAARAAALAFVNEATLRVWRLYLAGSAHGFAHDHLAVYQTLLVKPDPAGRSGLPLTRTDWYGIHAAAAAGCSRGGAAVATSSEGDTLSRRGGGSFQAV